MIHLLKSLVQISKITLLIAGVIYAQVVVAAENKKLILSAQAKPLVAKSTPISTRRNFTPLVMQFKPVEMARLNPVKDSKVQPKGPDAEKYLALRNKLEAEDNLLISDIETIASWDSDLIFQDKAAGHVFYYVPKQFLLVQNNEGYGLGVQYNKMDDPSKPSITFTAELSAADSTGDISLLKIILKQALGLKSNDPLEIKSISGIGMSIDVSSITTGLSIPEDRVQVIPPTHLHDNLRITFSLTQDEAESFLTQISHEGLSGSIKVPVDKTEVNIGFKIKYTEFAGEYTKGFKDWWLKKETIENLTNKTLFPISFNSINAYVFSNGKLKRINKKLGKKVTIKPGDSKSFKLPAAAKVIGNNIVMAWLDIEMETDCSSCMKNAKAQVGRGVSESPVSPITLEAIPGVFEDFEIYKLIIKLKSPYFNGDTEQSIKQRMSVKEVMLTEEENSTQLQLYFPQSKKNNPRLFKYQIKVIKANGETIKSAKWNDSSETSLLFGSLQLESLLGDDDSDEDN